MRLKENRVIATGLLLTRLWRRDIASAAATVLAPARRPARAGCRRRRGTRTKSAPRSIKSLLEAIFARTEASAVRLRTTIPPKPKPSRQLLQPVVSFVGTSEVCRESLERQPSKQDALRVRVPDGVGLRGDIPRRRYHRDRRLRPRPQGRRHGVHRQGLLLQLPLLQVREGPRPLRIRKG